MSKNDDKKTAIKLINKYADSYKLLEEENKSLRIQIKDLKANLQINKEIIEGFFNQNKKDKNAFCITKWQEENKKLYVQIETLNREKDELRSKLAYLEETSTERLNREKDENEKNKSKLFVMENAITKKENIILQLKKRLDRTNEDEHFAGDREIYIIEPSLAINQINDELHLYKQIFDNLAFYIRDTKDSISRYEILINELQNENSKLRSKYKQALSTKREKEASYLQAMKEGFLSTNPRTATENAKSYSDYSKKYFPEERNIIQVPRKATEDIKLQCQPCKSCENEEYMEILRNCGLNLENLEKFGRNVMYSRMIEALEMMARLVLDKNLSISVLEAENASLNSKNNALNKDNISLIQMNLELKKNLNTNQCKGSKTENSDSSMINNASSITISKLNIPSFQKQKDQEKSKNNNLNGNNESINTVKTVKTIKKKSKRESSTEGDVINYDEEGNEKKNEGPKENNTNSSNEEYSGHDSIIYTKDKKRIEKTQIQKEACGNQLNNFLPYKKKNTEITLMNNNNCQNVNTLESCTLSEFKEGLEHIESFVSIANPEDIANFNIVIKPK